MKGNRFFETRFLEEVDAFLEKLDPRAVKKVLYTIDRAEQTRDPELLKKLQSDIWEFRTVFGRMQIRLLAFWDKTDNRATLVIATNGFIKKGNSVPAREIDRAIRLREKYFGNT